MTGAIRAGAWWASQELHDAVSEAVREHLGSFHAANPLLEGAPLADVRSLVATSIGGAADPDLVDALLADLVGRGELAREGSTVRLTTHRVSLSGHEDEVDRLVGTVAAGEPTPPTVAELVASGFGREVIDAATRAGLLVRVSPDLVMTPGTVERAVAIVREAGPAGVTVSAFREGLETSRKYAVPLLEDLDATARTRRVGDVRVAREPG